MTINEELKSALIADVENICDVKLSEDTKESLIRCFEITIGTRYVMIKIKADRPVHIKSIKNKPRKN